MIKTYIKFLSQILCLVWLSLLCLSSANAKHLLVFGDSLGAAYGINIEKGWAHLLAQSWGDNHQVSNASISGETTVGGLARLPLTLEQLKPDVVFIELGANDGLRGYPIESIKKNLVSMVNLVAQFGAHVVIAGISLPPSYGPRYIDQFRGVFKQIADENNLPFIDLHQDSFFENPGYIQDDGLHPTEITQPIIRDRLMEFFAQQDLIK